MERRVERTFLDRQHVPGQHLNGLRDRVAVQRAGTRRLEHQHVQRAGHELLLLRAFASTHNLIMGVSGRPVAVSSRS